MKLKHITISLFVLVLTVFLKSCSTDDADTGNSVNYETEILGNWTLVSHSGSYEVSQSGISTKETGSDYNYSIEFTEEPQVINTSGSYTVNVAETTPQNETSSFSYVINSNQNQQEGVFIGTWSIEGGNLITRVYDNEPNEEGSYTLTTDIVELTDNKLVLKTDESASSSADYTVAGSTTLVFKR
ncbi:hypothetical protein [Leeuwenhoekiella nanhaiensis]|uniref:Lipocalin-like domain-containing protein n=1 Tax=Leeuwenhoekiella nanhaiensis TaxID=1655491 RepID=A0A2G1VUA7_9FLAO|nr:hypothetical protein [Leeuwenhoekiella nanhaiensis]PHQ30321.1 hypothetical protein CJ305_04985 [Leeuwenhoekiella nanhaiensis]